MGIENMRYGDMGRTDNILYHGRSSRSRSPPVGGGGRRGGGYDDSAGHGRIMDYGDSDGYLHDRRGPSPSSPSRYPRGRSPPRRGRSRSYSNERYDHHHSKRSNSWGGGTPHRRRNRHPVEQYVDEPMLCYHLWKESITKNKENEPDVEAKKGENDEIKSNNMNDATTVDQSQTQQTVEGNDADADAAAAATDNPTIVEENQEEEDSKFREEYNDYRERYCLDFVRGFFNEHLDDEWFKLRYSPLHRKNNAIKLRERASTEASTIKEEIMKQFESSNGPSAKEMFIAEARLGTGKKPTGNNYQRNRGKRAFSMEEENNELRDEELEYRNPIPSSHLLSGHAHCALEIQGVPAHVSDGQISQAIAEHSSSPPLRICSTTVGIGRDAGSTRPSFCNSLTRTVWAIFINEEAKEEMIENLTKANFEANRINDRNRSMDADIIPTIEAKSSHSTLELDVDHSDPYSRTEIDADGSGGAPKAIHEPEDPNHPNYQPTKERSMSIPKVPLRKSTVYVQTESRTREPNISVLSAAVSSRERIPRDKNAALMIARALDAAMSLQESIRLDNIVEILFSDKNDESEKVNEDILDVAIAYLRRVHLFSFYNGQAALCEGDVLSGFNPTGTIHLRLRDADSILQKALNEEAAKQDQLSTKIETSSNDDTTNGGEKVSQISQDLLVKRLDDSIAKALAESTAKIANFNIISEEVDAQASEIEKKENEAKAQWLTDHTLLDADGRARCSFHFCRKLFKVRLIFYLFLSSTICFAIFITKNLFDFLYKG